MGRPWKYDRLITALDDDELYHTAKVIKHGEGAGLFERSFDDEGLPLDAAQKKQAMKNARSSLAHFAAKRLSKEPDGFVEVSKPYRGSFPVYYGHTWKAALEANR